MNETRAPGRSELTVQEIVLSDSLGHRCKLSCTALQLLLIELWCVLA